MPTQAVTRYATTCDDVHIAYQVSGSGPPDIVFVWGIFSHVELVLEHEPAAHYARRLAGMGRLIHFDKRGTGLSDRACPLPTLEEQMDDVLSVMDAAGSERAILMGCGDAGMLCMLFAASHPERTEALVLSEPRARLTASADYPWGLTTEAWHAERDEIVRDWGLGCTQKAAAPSATDAASVQWWARLERYSLSPGSVAALWDVIERADVRAVLPSVSVPTLVTHRVGDRYSPIEGGRYVAGHIAGARFVELPGASHAAWADAADEELDEVEDFVTGRRTPGLRQVVPSERVLATVLFTDIVDSTATAVAVGDRRWRALLADHEAIGREEVERHRGRWVKSTGDGLLATFDGPGRAIRCAQAISSRLQQLGLQIRAGVHTGECEQLRDDIGGIAVHVAARVAGLASGGEVLASRTVVDLTAGSGLRFETRGHHALRGLNGDWPLYAAA
ncbi:MAG: adenylate/guanylate cyclase domain-containing protein [Acidimicrobiaceae bacterium]|nr:adenylate/guanylate cyclase domain-containing protein [Acidimicrobiaceae bacterium]